MISKKLGYGMFVFFVTLSLSLAAFGGEKYPSKAVQFLIPFGAGGSADVKGER